MINYMIESYKQINGFEAFTISMAFIIFIPIFYIVYLDHKENSK